MILLLRSTGVYRSKCEGLGEARAGVSAQMCGSSEDTGTEAGSRVAGEGETVTEAQQPRHTSFRHRRQV